MPCNIGHEEIDGFFPDRKLKNILYSLRLALLFLADI